MTASRRVATGLRKVKRLPSCCSERRRGWQGAVNVNSCCLDWTLFCPIFSSEHRALDSIVRAEMEKWPWQWMFSTKASRPEVIEKMVKTKHFVFD